MAKPQVGDVTAAIAVALLLIPQCLAYAELAGMPAHVGLIAASIPPIIASVWIIAILADWSGGADGDRHLWRALNHRNSWYR